MRPGGRTGNGEKTGTAAARRATLWAVAERRSVFQFVDAERRFEWRDPERFDRLAFALRVLDVLRPNVEITLYPRLRGLRVHQGRDFTRGGAATWATIGIPPDASREHIVVALAELSGKAHIPFLVDWLSRSFSTPTDEPPAPDDGEPAHRA